MRVRISAFEASIVSGANADDDDYVLDEGEDDFDIESLDLDEETPVEVVEDILADDTDAQ